MDGAGLQITKDDITLPQDYDGRSTGEAYVKFRSQEDSEKALAKNKQEIGHRWETSRWYWYIKTVTPMVIIRLLNLFYKRVSFSGRIRTDVDSSL